MSDKKSDTKKLTLAAAMAAISAVCIIITNFAPLTFSLLMVAAFCYYLTFEKCGIVYGFLCIAASILISFFTSTFSTAFFLIVIMFAPYSVIAYFIRKLRYTVIKEMIIRVIIMIVFGIIEYIAVYFLASTIEIDLSKFFDAMGRYFTGVIFIVFVLIFDLLFNQLSIRVSKLIK